MNFAPSHGARHAVTLKGEKNGDLACISKKCCIFATSIAKNLTSHGARHAKAIKIKEAYYADKQSQNR